MQHKLDKLLVFLLADMANEGLSSELLAELVGDESVFGERIVKVVDDCKRQGLTRYDGDLGFLCQSR